MAEDEIKRVNFFDGQFLKQGEFLDLDTYHRHMRRRWAYVLFNQSGVIQATPTDLTIAVEDATQKKIRVRAGMAIGKRDEFAEAREIVLREDQILDLNAQQPPLQAGDTAIIAIHYEEEAVADPPSEGDTPGKTRVKEHAVVTVHRNNLPGSTAGNGEPFVRLGDVNFQQMAINTGQRQTALINAALVGTQAQPQAPTITGINPTQLAQGASLTPVTITGTNLNGASAVTFSTANVTAQAVAANATGTQVTANVSVGLNAPVGPVTFSVATPAGTAQSGPVTLTIQPTLQLTGFAGVNEPNNDLLFKINGSGFAPPVIVEFSASGGGFAQGIPLSPQNVTATQITIPNAQIPANATNGPVRVQSGGQAVTSAFNVMPPPVLANVPAQAATQTNITITGNRFFAGTSVTLPGNLVRGPNSQPPFPAAGLGESLTPTQIVVRVISNAGTAAKVRVTTQGGTVQSTTILSVS